VILKPTTFRNDQVLMSAARFGGQSLFDDKDMFNARYADTIVAAMGLKDFSPLDMRKILAGKAAASARAWATTPTSSRAPRAPPTSRPCCRWCG
jgi:hypothetical protein